MALFKKDKKSEPVKPTAVKPAFKAEPKEEKKPVKAGRVAKKEFSDAYKVLKKPLVTEKSFVLNNKNQYVFEVMPGANKSEVKKAVQDLYGARVTRVNIINVPGKKRRLGRHEGFKPGFKKAIVCLAPDEKIEIISR